MDASRFQRTEETVASELNCSEPMKTYLAVRGRIDRVSCEQSGCDRIRVMLDGITEELPFRRMAALLFQEGRGDGILARGFTSSGFSKAESRALDRVIIPVHEKDSLLANALTNRSVCLGEGRQLLRGLATDSNLVAILPLYIEEAIVPCVQQKAPFHITENGAIGVVVGELADDAWQSETVLELLKVISNDIASSIVNAELQEMIFSKVEQFGREMTMARAVQQALLPRNIPKLPGLELYANSLPAMEVGGDFYHFIPMREEESKLGIMIGDAAGKGPSAAILMAVMASAIKQFAQRLRDPSRVLAKANRYLLAQLGEYTPYVMTAFYGVLDVKKNTLVFANAGHVPPIHYRNKDKECTFLQGSGVLLGGVRDYRLENRTVELFPGDKIVFYTDGVNDARNPKGEFYGDGRLLKLVQRNGQKGAQELLRLIQEDVITHIDNPRAQQDDIAIVVCSVELE